MDTKFLWLLDNGHGIDTPGKRSPKLPDGRQFLEYRFNREVVKNISILLKAMNIHYHILVPEEHDVSLMERVERANDLKNIMPCVLVSVHANAYGEGSGFSSPRGIETYYQDNILAGEKLADMFQENLLQVTGWRDRGVKPGRFYILRNVDMPAVLTESGFYSNREELQYLLDPDWQIRIAEAHAEAISEIEEMGAWFFQGPGSRLQGAG